MRGDGCVYLRGKTYWLAFRGNGQKYQVSANTTSKTKAIKMLRAEQAKLTAGTFVNPADRNITVGDLVADMLRHYELNNKARYSQDTRQRWDKNMKFHLQYVPASNFGTEHQERYRAARLELGAAYATINREMAILSKAFRLAYQAEPPKVQRVPRVLFFREDNARKVFITPVQLAAIRKAAEAGPLWVRVLIEMAYTLGWRRGELLGLRVQDVDLAGGVVRIETSKNGEPRETPLTPGLLVLLEAMVTGRAPSKPVFPIQDIRRAWTDLLTRAGVTGIHFHDFRRTSARAKRNLGIDISVIMELQGWKTADMFRRYAIVSNEDKLVALNLMGGADA